MIISSPGEYEFVTLPQTMTINGGIFPNRVNDSNTYGEPKVIRGEDPAFLMEAVAERLAAGDGRYSYYATGAGHQTMTHVILGSRIQTIIQNMSGLAETSYTRRFGVVPSSLPQIVPATENGQAASWWTSMPIVQQATGISQPNIQSDFRDFYRGSPLRLDKINLLYRDIEQLRWFTAGKTYSQLSGGYGRKNPFYHSAYNGGNPSRSYTDTFIPSGGLVWMKQYDTVEPLAFNLVDSAFVYLCIQTYVSQGSTSQWFWDYVLIGGFGSTYDITRNDQEMRYEIPASTCVAVAEVVRQQHGITPLPYQSLEPYTSQQIEQEIFHIAGMFRLTDRTAVDTIQWTWPQVNA